MTNQLRAASQEVRAQLLDGRSNARSFGEGINAWQAMAIIDQALDGIPDPEPPPDPEKPAKKTKGPRA